MGILKYDNNDFYMEDQKYRILSGSMHYFRIVPQYWRDRLMKLKACGLNTVETYTCWNLHEKREGEFDFTGILDIKSYIETAMSLGLNVILRPGPYICGEWDFGGLPSWLLRYKGMRIRCHDELFLSKVKNYFDRLFQIIRPYLCTNGGNIIAVQIENEYGSYGNDKKYLQAIADIYKENKIDCLLFTSDGPTNFMLNAGSLEPYPAAVNFGSNPEENFALLDSFRKNQPKFCCEYWNGWFDHWYEEHHVRADDNTAETFERILMENASVNFYMFHGGTNFSYYNGANYDNGIQPTVTSYDYNCPVNENGDLTPKYYSIKAVIEKYFGKAPELEVGNIPRKTYGMVSLLEEEALFDNLENLSHPTEASYTMTMEELNQNFGFVLYTTVLTGPFEEAELTIDGLRDRAIVYIDGKQAGIMERTGKRMDSIRLGLGFHEKVRLDILVENLGRINYGSKIWDEKGILRGVKIGQIYHYGWKMYPLPCEDINGLDFKKTENSSMPAFLRGYFEVEEIHDTFVRLDGFTKGNVYINGFHLGRYWNSAGPQKTLYLPGPLLRQGKNELVILELEKTEKREVLLTDTWDLG